MRKKSMCGLYCDTCEFVEKCGCKGCVESAGNPFHGSCSVAKCCLEKKIAHCGLCEEFPCELLHGFSYDPVHGDNGKRIEEIKKWVVNPEQYN